MMQHGLHVPAAFYGQSARDKQQHAGTCKACVSSVTPSPAAP